MASHQQSWNAELMVRLFQLKHDEATDAQAKIMGWESGEALIREIEGAFGSIVNSYMVDEDGLVPDRAELEELPFDEFKIGDEDPTVLFTMGDPEGQRWYSFNPPLWKDKAGNLYCNSNDVC